MKIKPKTWKIGKHLTIKMTPEKFSSKNLLELIIWIILIVLIIWWLM